MTEGASKGNDQGPTKLRIGSSLLSRAKSGDKDAIATMFRQFISADEDVVLVEYLGRQGAFGMGTHSFGAVTQRRVAAIRTGAFGEVVYQDAWIEGINSSVFYQPSLKVLYVLLAIVGLTSLVFLLNAAFGRFYNPSQQVMTIALGVLVFVVGVPLVVALFHKLVKSGLVFAVAEGVSVYMYCNRNRLSLANSIWRHLTALREKRIESRPHRL